MLRHTIPFVSMFFTVCPVHDVEYSRNTSLPDDFMHTFEFCVYLAFDAAVGRPDTRD